MKNLSRSLLKKSPFGLLKSIESKVKTNKMRNFPAWYEAMKLVPMAPMPSPYDDFAQSGAFNAQNASVEESQRFYAQNQTRRIQKRKNLAVMPIRTCREIEYPEDRLRSKFYSSHPFELHRPRSIIEDENALLYRDWSSIYGGNIPTPVSGER